MKYPSLITALVLAAITPLVLGATGGINLLTTAYAQEEKPQLNVAEAQNVAVQLNVCGNYGIVKDQSDVSCSNVDYQKNIVTQTQTQEDPNGDGGSNTQINVADTHNIAVQANVCGNYGIVKEKSDVSCSNQADQSNQVDQTQAADPNGDDGKNTQLNYATASNTAYQVNACGNYGLVKDGSAVSCSNQADQSNLIGQLQQISHEEP
jgi:hypothetical protein